MFDFGLSDLGRPLTQQELAFYKPYFNQYVLQSARVIDGSFGGKVPFWLRKEMSAVVLGRRIYLRAGVYQPNTVRGISLLGHELTHVAQFCYGMTVFKYLWSCRHGYMQSPYEVQAYAMGARIAANCVGNQ
jgi:Domain of unknown function (DUF4157)